MVGDSRATSLSLRVSPRIVVQRPEGLRPRLKVMSYTVFYAWQMDSDKQLNRWLIHRAAESAIESLVSSTLEDAPGIEPGEIEQRERESSSGPEIELDHDTKGEPGTVIIAEAILKKIDNCGVFLADVTLVGTVQTADGREKRVPNSNVLIELGAAIKSVGWERIILVMNRAYGSAEDLPFDLKYRGIKVGYELSDENLADKGRILKELSGQIASQLREIQNKGVIKHRETEARRRREQEVAERGTEAVEERRAFEHSVAINEFHSLKSEVGVLAVSVIPFKAARLEFLRTHEARMRQFVRTSYFSGSPMKVGPRSAVSQDNAETPAEVAELMDTGTLLWALHVMRGNDSTPTSPQLSKVDPSKAWPLHVGADFMRSGLDLFVSEWLSASLAGLRDLGVAGPWYIGISLLKTRNCVLMPLRGSIFVFDPDRRSREYHMAGETAVVPAEIDLSSPAAINELLKRPWRQIWRHSGWNGIPRLDRVGQFHWEE
jgi:DNA-binding PadR family transcriptional regulator